MMILKQWVLSPTTAGLTNPGAIRSEAAAAQAEKSVSGAGGWGRVRNAAQIPRTHIYCNDPAVGPFGQFAERLQRDTSWRYAELATGHDAMITAPAKVAELLLRRTDV
jgi:hypothetical protein